MLFESKEQISDKDFMQEFTEFVEKYSRIIEKFQKDCEDRSKETYSKIKEKRPSINTDNIEKVDKIRNRNSKKEDTHANKIYTSMMQERHKNIIPLREKTKKDFFSKNFIIGNCDQSLYQKIIIIERLYGNTGNISEIEGVFSDLFQYKGFSQIIHDTNTEEYNRILGQDNFENLKKKYDESIDIAERIILGESLFTLRESKQQQWYLEQEVKKPRKESSFDYDFNRLDTMKSLIPIPSEEEIRTSKKSIHIPGKELSNIVSIGSMTPTSEQMYTINNNQYNIYFTSLENNDGYLGWYNNNDKKICININQCKNQYQFMKDIGISGLGSEENFIKAIILQERSHHEFKATEAESEIASLETGGLSYLSFRLLGYIYDYINGGSPGIGIKRYESMNKVYMTTLETIIDKEIGLKEKVESAKSIMLNTQSKLGSKQYFTEIYQTFSFLFTQEFADQFIALYKQEVKSLSEKYKK